MSRMLAIAALLAVGAALAACAMGDRARKAPDVRLLDDRGQPWQLEQQRGAAVLLTFGFTHCRDTCPTTLAKLSRLAGLQRFRAQAIEIAFITVDPRRDSPAVMHRFLGAFAVPAGDRIVGLTGTPAEILNVETAYHVWSARSANDVAHSSVIFLIDARGRLRALADDDQSEQSLARAVGSLAG